MINVKLAAAMFTAGYPFYKVTRNRAVLPIGTGRLPITKIGTAGFPNYRGGDQRGFQVDARGTEFSDDMLETIMNNPQYQVAYGMQLLSLVDQGYVEVYQDGIIVPVATLKIFTA